MLMRQHSLPLWVSDSLVGKKLLLLIDSKGYGLQESAKWIDLVGRCRIFSGIILGYCRWKKSGDHRLGLGYRKHPVNTCK